ncbi:hypothetical protein N865_12995 [Intrasporangium oryzae NRRL B-24470]|uniref:OmpR/PhoB-type domain-containing protein n=1 Tax=Intrasporangium oryzae NRRL B-24470 TaxID=1386089 RepID=W9G8R9_9MICO|nr:AfsR/SARP family transcriptional regulator [Intrasporangium oryzae]EWT00269.1 hypothetical protein N865_12995 [Intrasporangium oryzae NRRL B-24470]
MRARVFGDLEMAATSGEPAALGGRLPRALLGVLLAAEGRSVSTERIIDQLWGEAPPPNVLATLQVHVARLRRALEPDRDARAPARLLVTRPAGYAVELPRDAVDAWAFEDLLGRAAAGPGRAAEPLLVQALALYRGPAYPGLHDVPLLLSEATRLDELRLQATERLWLGRIEQGRADEAIPPLSALADEHPTREGLSALLVRALYASGRQAEALAALRRVRDHLADELGIDPGEELRELEAAVLRQDASLLPRDRSLTLGAGRAAAQTDSTASGSAAVDSAAAASAPVDSVRVEVVPLPAPDPGSSLAGRREVLAATDTLVASAASGSGRVLLVVGEPGIGKTRLCAAVAQQAEAAGLRVSTGTWDPDGCPPLWGWTTALAGLGHGDLAHGVTPGPDSASVVFRLAEDIATALAEQPTCLVLDDIQWADADSQRLLVRMADLAGSLPVLLVVTSRDGLAEDSPAQATMAALARSGVERVSLEGLGVPEVRDLVTDLLGLAVDEEQTALLHERAAGNPFYVIELARYLSTQGALTDVTHEAWTSVPHGVRDTVRHRVGSLAASVGRALAMASVLGRHVDLDVLEAMWDAPLEALDQALDESIAAGLLAETGAGRLEFTHALVRDALYSDIAPLTRRRWHAEAAIALERLRAGHLDQHVASVAEHYRLAGPAQVRPAWLHTQRAAELAARSGAHDDSARLLTVAAQLQASDPLCQPAERRQLELARGTALRRSGRIASAWDPLQSVARSHLAEGDAVAAARALLVVTEQVMWSWRTAHVADEEAIALWLRVLDALPGSELGLRARCLAALSVETMHDPPGGRCGSWVEESMALARRSGDLTALCDVLHIVLNPLRRPDLAGRRLAAADELVALTARQGDEPSLAVALTKRALSHSTFARPDAALADLRRALPIATRHHVAPALMAIHYGQAVLALAAGDHEACETSLLAGESVQRSLFMAGAGMGALVRATSLLVRGEAEAAYDLSADGRVHPALDALPLLCLTRSGRASDVRELVGPWQEQPELPFDYLWLTGTVLRALLWSELGDAEAAAELHVTLLAYADRIADGAMAATFAGSVEHALAVTALASGQPDVSRAHAEQALDLHRRLGWREWETASEQVLGQARGESWSPTG